MTPCGTARANVLACAVAGLVLVLSGELLIVDGQALAQALRTALLSGAPDHGARRGGNAAT